MDPSTDVFESITPFEIIPAYDDEAEADPAIEINARRAQVEDPEMLRRLRSL